MTLFDGILSFPGDQTRELDKARKVIQIIEKRNVKDMNQNGNSGGKESCSRRNVSFS